MRAKRLGVRQRSCRLEIPAKRRWLTLPHSKVPLARPFSEQRGISLWIFSTQCEIPRPPACLRDPSPEDGFGSQGERFGPPPRRLG